MPTSPLIISIQALSALAISLFSAWLTVRLSQNKFRSERLWDRKVSAYERVIEAFHNSKKFSYEHMRAEYSGEEVSEERDKELRQHAKQGMEEIRRTTDIGSFTLSEQAMDIISEYEHKSNETNHIESWREYLHHDFETTDEYMQKFINEAKRDLAH
ncbi:hypothetical protein [Pseudomonas mosselii]|uniref:hypothetical protein n=1 Tax=Pseudomonas mosselii TaxID=78327 RepID=UPI001F4C056E|nr:hypothetical protein [Pseudomonas mosselii]MCH7418280.1 hypothetical protein [Pseudomonas mosselii]